MSDGATEMALEERKQHEELTHRAFETSTDLVIRDMARREGFGYHKYGKYLHVNTDEDMLVHLYEELLDGAVYIRTLIEQRKKGIR